MDGRTDNGCSHIPVFLRTSVQKLVFDFEGLPQGWTDPSPMAVKDSLDKVLPWIRQERFVVDFVSSFNPKPDPITMAARTMDRSSKWLHSLQGC